jgi:GT2 family glycosyltransferase
MEITETRVYIILLNWNGWKDTVQCLESVLRSRYTGFRVIVCDNRSSDGSMEKIKDWANGARPVPYVEYCREEAENGGRPGDKDVPLVLIQNGSNDGFSAGNNVGIRYALKKNAEYIWLLNNDTIIQPDTLSELVGCMQSDDAIGLAGAVIYQAGNPGEIQAYGGGRITPVTGVDRFVHSPGRMDFVSGTSLFIKRRVLEQVGLLDERFFFYWEDADFSRRALDRGWKLAVADNASVYHKFSATVGAQSLKSDLFKVDSLIRYFKKHRKVSWFIPVTVNIAGMIIKRLIRRQFDRVVPIIKAIRGALFEK